MTSRDIVPVVEAANLVAIVVTNLHDDDVIANKADRAKPFQEETWLLGL